MVGVMIKVSLKSTEIKEIKKRKNYSFFFSSDLF